MRRGIRKERGGEIEALEEGEEKIQSPRKGVRDATCSAPLSQGSQEETTRPSMAWRLGRGMTGSSQGLLGKVLWKMKGGAQNPEQ